MIEAIQWIKQEKLISYTLKVSSYHNKVDTESRMVSATTPKHQQLE